MTTMLLTYQPPYDWQWMTAFLGARALQGVEQQDGEFYQRTLTVKHNGERLTGWIRLRPLAGQHSVELQVSPSLEPVADNVAQQVRRLLDLDAEPQQIAAGLGSLAENAIGLRLPGCVNRFELVVRAIPRATGQRENGSDAGHAADAEMGRAGEYAVCGTDASLPITGDCRATDGG